MSRSKTGSAFSRVIAIAAVMIGCNVSAIDLYIDGTNGNDSWDGTAAEFEEGTNHGPIKTFTRFKNLYNKTDNMILHIAGGVYGTSQPFSYWGSTWTSVTIIGSDDPENPTVFDGNNADACFTINNAYRHARFENLVFRNGFHKERCAAIYTAQNYDYVSFTNCVFENCVSTNGANSRNGGAVCINQLRMPDFYRCTFRNCTASGQGGALAINDGTNDLCFTECTFEGNTSLLSQGGAISASAFASNEMTTVGLVLKDCHFRTNSAPNGGAMYGAVRLATNCTFVGNCATNGGVWCLSGYSGKWPSLNGSYLMTNCYQHCVFADNVANADGGAFRWSYNKRFKFEDCVFSNNVCAASGAVFGEPGELSDLTLERCQIVRNRGEGIFASVPRRAYTSAFGYRWRDVLVADNDAGSTVGFLFHSGSHTVAWSATNCVFRGNIGGQLLMVGGSGSTNALANLLFAANTNRTGSTGIIYLEWQGLPGSRLSNCTFVDNAAAAEPYAVYSNLDGNWPAQFENCVVFNNCSTNGATGKEVSNGFLNASRNCFYVTGTSIPKNRDNVTGMSPRFYAGSYVPRMSSPLRGKGLVADWMADEVDLAGRARLNGDGTVDIGAYSYELRYGLMMIFR